MKRRKFIKKSGVLGIATILPIPYIPFIKRRPKITPIKDFGAVGDGVTDDTLALQSWAAAVTDISNTEGTHYFDRNKTYLITEEFDLNVLKEFDLDGQNATIRRQYFPETLDVTALNVTFEIRNAQPFLFPDLELALPIKKGDTTITVVDATGVIVGAGLRLQGELLYYLPAYNEYEYKGILATVTSVVGNVIGISTPAPADFTVGANSLFRVTEDVVFPVSFRNINIESFANQELFRAGNVRQFKLTGFFDSVGDNIGVNTEGFNAINITTNYNGRFTNFYTTYPLNTIYGAYGFSPLFNVNSTFTNFNINSQSHALVQGNTCCYGTKYFGGRYICSPGWGGSFDSHIALETEAIGVTTDQSIYWGYGTLLYRDGIIRSAESPDGRVLGVRNPTGVRVFDITITNNDIEVDGIVRLFDSKVDGDNSMNWTNNRFVGEGVLIVPSPKLNFSSNTMEKANGDVYNLLDSPSLVIPEFTNNYFDFSTATAGIMTPINLFSLSNFTWIIRAKAPVINGSEEPLIASGVNFYIRLEQSATPSEENYTTTFKVVLKGLNGDLSTFVGRFDGDDNVHTYGVTVDCNDKVSLYVDGHLINVLPCNISSIGHDATIEIGKRNATFYKGGINKIVFYPRTLDREEMQQSYLNLGSVVGATMELNLPTSATEWLDASGSGNDCNTIGAGITLETSQ